MGAVPVGQSFGRVMNRSALVGLLSGVFLVVVTLIGVAMLNMPQAAGAAPSVRRGPPACTTGHKAAEQGYGIAPAAATCAATD